MAPQHQAPRACMWVRDLTEEGIEPHPGPSTSTSPRVISKNVNGLQQGTKFKNFVKYVYYQHQKRPIIGVCVQEHNLSSADREQHQRIAHHFRVLAIINYAPGNGRGGAAVFIPYDSITLRAGETRDQAISRVALTKEVRLAGAFTAVTTDIDGTAVQIASYYAPVSPAPLRRQSIKSMSTYLSKSTIIGMDANCVPDTDLDLKRTSTSKYDNAGATELADAVSRFDLSDIARDQLGDESFFTSHHSTADDGVCHSRIDQIYTPNLDGLLWTHEPAADFWPGSTVDHDAIQASLTVATGERGHDVTRINEAIFDDPAFNKKIAEEVTKTWNLGQTLDSGQRWVNVKAAVANMCDAETLRLKKLRAKAQTALDDKIDLLERSVAAGDADASELAELGSLRKERRDVRHRARSAYMETESFAVKQGATHDTGRAAFYRQWTPRNASEWIQAMRDADWTDPSKPVFTGGATGEASEIANEFAKYYKSLFAQKTPDPDALRDALAALSAGNKVLPPTAAKCAAPIDQNICEATCNKLPTGKSPGPDRIPNKFYVVFSKLLAPLLTTVYNDARDAGALHPDILTGNISVMYKKKERDDPRNYRPITLLNGDYKILMRILTARMNEAVVQFVSPPQNGFVPDSFIAENLMLLKLIQAYVEDEDESAMFLFADMEKAFDRASWEFMEHALDALGLGNDPNAPPAAPPAAPHAGPAAPAAPPTFKSFFQLAYSHQAPPTRRVYANGYLSDPFPINSGVAQGCPLSPLLFLLVTEVITRLITQDANYKGVEVDGVRHKLSQFADDSTFILSLGDEAHLARHLLTWEGATGQLENADKREGMLLGALRRRPETAPAIVPGGWLRDGKSIRALGVPMGNVFDETEWWLARYRVVKRRICLWKSTSHVSLVGRNMLLQAYYFGSFRYWLFSMILPPSVNQLIREDAKALLWAGSPDLCANEEGTEKRSNRFIHERASYRSRRDGGGGVMHWDLHVEAFYAQWGRQYLDPREAPWKSVMDHWIGNRYHMGRGALLITTGAQERFWLDLPKQARYARRCIRAFEDLHVTLDASHVTPDTLAWPLFNNSLFDVKLPAASYDIWQNYLMTTQLGDLLDEDGDLFTDQAWSDFFYELAPESIRSTPRVHEWVDARKAELPAIQRAVPELPPPGDDPHAVHGAWVGVFRRTLTHENERPIRWAQVERTAGGGIVLHELWLDTSRKPHLTGKQIPWFNQSIIEASTWLRRGEPKSIVMYDGVRVGGPSPQEELPQPVLTIAGLRGSRFPADEGWHLHGQSPRMPSARAGQEPPPRRLTALTIQHITSTLTARYIGDARPNCEAAWEERIGRKLPWPQIWRSVGHELLDATIESRWFKLLHRAIFTRNRQTDSTIMCRLQCRSGLAESQIHLIRCSKLQPFWDAIFAFLRATGAPDPYSKEEAIIFGLFVGNNLGPPLALAVLRIAFSEMYRLFALVDTESRRFEPLAAELATYQTLKGALQRRGAGVRKMHANRIFTSRTPVISESDARKYDSVLSLETDGAYAIEPLLENAIASTRAKLDASRAARRALRAAARQRRGAQRPAGR